MTAAVIGVALAGAGRAQADILLTVSDGVAGDTQLITIVGNIGSASYNIDGYQGDISVVGTNLPGLITGTLTTTTTINQVASSPVGPLTVLAQVVTPSTVGNGSGGFTVGGLANFTSPTGTPLLLTNNNTAVGTSGNTAATFAGSSTANGVTTSSTINVDAPQEGITTTTFSASGTYTLQNRTVITGLQAGDTNVSFGVASTVAAPEPSTLATALVALPFVGLVALRRKGRKQA